MTVTLLRAALAILAVSILPAPSSAQDAFFEEGNQRYQDGDFQGALDSYLRIGETGSESAALYYNIGNAYFKLGNLGRSILHFERALRLDPRNEDARANLDLAASLTVDEVTPLPGFWLLGVIEWWVHLVPPAGLTLVVIAAYLIAAAAVVAWVLAPPRLARWGRPVGLAAATVALVFGINLFARELGIGQPREAVVLVAEASVQSAPSQDRDLQVFTIHEGSKVRIDQESGGWAEIVLLDGKVGWVPVEVLEKI